METENKVIDASGILDEKKLTGTWKLTYKISNTLKDDAFGMYHLGPYTDPLTGKECFRKELNGRRMMGYEVTRKESFISVGADNPQGNLDIVWLLNHPSIRVEGFKLDKRVIQSKKSNPRMTLVNLDNQMESHIDEQEEIDKLIAELSNAKNITLKKLKFINAALNKKFFDSRYINNPSAESRMLRHQVKDYVRGNIKNARIVKDVLKDLDSAQKTYEVKRALQLGILYATNGSIKDKENSIVLGHDVNRVILYVNDNSDYYLSLQERLKKAEADAKKDAKENS